MLSQCEKWELYCLNTKNKTQMWPAYKPEGLQAWKQDNCCEKLWDSSVLKFPSVPLEILVKYRKFIPCSIILSISLPRGLGRGFGGGEWGVLICLWTKSYRVWIKVCFSVLFSREKERATNHLITTPKNGCSWISLWKQPCAVNQHNLLFRNSCFQEATKQRPTEKRRLFYMYHGLGFH